MDSCLLKGIDRTTAAIGGDTGVSDRDEIAKYLHGRYISPSEAAWQLFVAVHLPGKQPLFFPEDLTATQVREQVEKQESTLMAFFRYNAEHPDDEDALNLLYQDFPLRYTFNMRTRRWTKRKTSKTAPCG